MKHFSHKQKAQTGTHNLKRRNRWKKYGIPPNISNRHKHKGKEAMAAQNYQKIKAVMAMGNPHISIITLNVNGLNSPIKNTE